MTSDAGSKLSGVKMRSATGDASVTPRMMGNQHAVQRVPRLRVRAPSAGSGAR